MSHTDRDGPGNHGVVAPFRYPAAGGCATTVGLNPYRGAAKPHPRPPAPPAIGIPGMPGAPGVADASSIPGGLYQPPACAGDGAAAAAWLAAGAAAAQLCGTDIVPTKVARPTPADTAWPPRPDDPSEPIAEPAWLNPALIADDEPVP